MNRENIIRQFRTLLTHLLQQIALSGDPASRELRFDKQLFPEAARTLQGYALQIQHNIEKLERAGAPSSPGFIWLSERIMAQCQAIQRELTAAPERSPLRQNEAAYWLNKYQQQLGYEARLNEMLQQHEQQMTRVETLKQQQEIAEKITQLEQRLARCRHALKETHWQTLLRN